MVRRLIVWKVVYYCFCMRSIFWLNRPTSSDHIVDRQSTTGTEWMDLNWTRIVQVNVWATDSARGCELRNKFSLTLCQTRSCLLCAFSSCLLRPSGSHWLPMGKFKIVFYRLFSLSFLGCDMSPVLAFESSQPFFGLVWPQTPTTYHNGR